MEEQSSCYNGKKNNNKTLDLKVKTHGFRHLKMQFHLIFTATLKGGFYYYLHFSYYPHFVKETKTDGD